jgi:hypothetical protein
VTSPSFASDRADNDICRSLDEDYPEAQAATLTIYADRQRTIILQSTNFYRPGEESLPTISKATAPTPTGC